MKFLLLFLMLPFAAFCQETDEDFPIDVEPQFQGGERALHEFIRDNVHYPTEAKEKGEQGAVYVKFIVEKDGTLTNIEVVKSVSKSLDEEAARIVELMPKWTPGTRDGKPVRVIHHLPINFRLG